MNHYSHTPRMVTPRLAPQPVPVAYTSVSAPSPYYNPGQQLYHVAASEPLYSRGHHRSSSSRSHKHRRSHSTDRHGGSRHHRHHHRSSTPSRSMSAHYSPAAQYATIPSSRHRRHSVSDHRYLSSREPRRSVHYGPHEHHYRRESIGERIKRFFGIGTHKVKYVDPSGHRVDRFGRPVYAM